MGVVVGERRVMGVIFALDLGSHYSGFCYGAAGTVPVSASVRLRKQGQPVRVAYGNLIAFLLDHFGALKPALVAVEAPMPVGGKRDSSAASLIVLHKLDGIVEGMCERYGLRRETAHPQTVRKHFLGHGRIKSFQIGRSDREETKAAVLARCKLLKLIPPECADDNRADAVALWDWAAATFGRRSPSTSTLHLFGETQANQA